MKSVGISEGPCNLVIEIMTPALELIFRPFCIFTGSGFYSSAFVEDSWNHTL